MAGTPAPWLQERLQNTYKALTTPGGTPCLYGVIDRDPYLEGPFTQHRYVMSDPRPAWAPETLGLPRMIILMPGSEIADNALRASIGNWVNVYGTHYGWFTLRNERFPVVTVETVWQKGEEMLCPVPGPPLLPPTTPTTPTAPGVTPQQLQQVNAILQQLGVGIEVTPENVNEILTYLRDTWGIDIQL